MMLDWNEYRKQLPVGVKEIAQLSGDPSEEASSPLADEILEHIADAVIYADDTGTIRRWNHAAADLFGYSAAEAVGSKLDVIIPEHLRSAHWRGFEAAMTNGATKLQGRPT